MITLIVCPKLKGTAKQFAKILIISLCIDALSILGVTNLFI